MNIVCIPHKHLTPIPSLRHNASGLKEIALEYILRNLKDQTVELGLHDLKSEPDLLVEIITRTSDSRGDNMADAAADFGGEWSER